MSLKREFIKYNDAIDKYEKYFNGISNIDIAADYLEYYGKNDERNKLYEKKGEEADIKVRIPTVPPYYEEKRYSEACSHRENLNNRIQKWRETLIKNLNDFLDDKINNNIKNYKL